MEHKTPAQNGVALTELPQISGFVSMSITEGSAAKKNWKPVWGTNVNTPPQPYTLSFYESPSERTQGAAPIVKKRLKTTSQTLLSMLKIIFNLLILF